MVSNSEGVGIAVYLNLVVGRVVVDPASSLDDGVVLTIEDLVGFEFVDEELLEHVGVLPAFFEASDDEVLLFPSGRISRVLGQYQDLDVLEDALRVDEHLLYFFFEFRIQIRDSLAYLSRLLHLLVINLN